MKYLVSKCPTGKCQVCKCQIGKWWWSLKNQVFVGKVNVWWVNVPFVNVHFANVEIVNRGSHSKTGFCLQSKCPVCKCPIGKWWWSIENQVFVCKVNVCLVKVHFESVQLVNDWFKNVQLVMVLWKPGFCMQITAVKESPYLLELWVAFWCALDIMTWLVKTHLTINSKIILTIYFLIRIAELTKKCNTYFLLSLIWKIAILQLFQHSFYKQHGQQFKV